MARIGCLCLPATGHLNPVSALGYELSRRGHEVVVFNVPDTRDAVRQSGLQFVPFGDLGFPQGTKAERDQQLAPLTGMRAAVCSAQYMLKYTQAVLNEAPPVVFQSNVDLLVVDQCDPAAHAVASHAGIPFVTVALCLILNEHESQPAWGIDPPSAGAEPTVANRRAKAIVGYLFRPFLEAVNRYRLSAGLSAVGTLSDTWSTLAQIAQQPEGFDYPRPLPDCFHFAGPFCNPAARRPVAFPYDKLNGKPLVYAAFGSMVNCELGLIRAIAQACSLLDVQLVISLGGGGAAESLTGLAGDPIVVSFAPQLEILARARLMITHAGLNSTLECLSAGVPMVAIPITNDEPAIAARIAWTKTGVVVPLADGDAPRLARAIEEVLGQAAYREGTQKLKRALASIDGSRRAADIIERVMVTKRPVLRSDIADRLS